MSEEFEELKKRMEGKTVVSVEPPNAREAICKFVLSDGSAFRLHATELGFWMEDTVAKTGQKYTNLSALCTDCGEEHSEYCFRMNNYNSTPEVKIKNNILIVTFDTVNGKKTLQGDITKFSDWEKKVCLHKKGLKLLSEAMVLGDLWTMVFSKHDDRCPKELYK